MQKVVVHGKPLVWRAPYVGTLGAWSVRTPILSQIKAQIRQTYALLSPVNEYVAVDLIFYLPIPKSASKKKRDRMLAGLDRPEGGGDRINYGKLMEDALQGVVIENDRMIMDGRVAKLYGDPTRTEIFVYPLEEYLQKYPLPS